MLIVVIVLLLWHQIVLLWHQVIMVASEQHLYQTIVQFDNTIVLPRKLATGSIHDYLFATAHSGYSIWGTENCVVLAEVAFSLIHSNIMWCPAPEIKFTPGLDEEYSIIGHSLELFSYDVQYAKVREYRELYLCIPQWDGHLRIWKYQSIIVSAIFMIL